MRTGYAALKDTTLITTVSNPTRASLGASRIETARFGLSLRRLMMRMLSRTPPGDCSEASAG